MQALRGNIAGLGRSQDGAAGLLLVLAVAKFTGAQVRLELPKLRHSRLR